MSKDTYCGLFGLNRGINVKIFSLGIDSLTIEALKNEGYQVIPQKEFPDTEQVKDQVFILTSEHCPLDRLSRLRDNYPDAIIFYQFLKKGVRGFRQVHLLCESLNIHFISSMATKQTFIDKLKLIFEEDIDFDSRIIGFFGSGPGIGCTSVAASFANRISLAGGKVIMLGLNLFDPGWNQKTKISLDQWRPKLTGKIIQSSDFENLIQVSGFSYLPGNFDYISSMDYQEHEIEYLLQEAQKHADIVVADFGSIPQSAAWYVGMQLSGIRYYITKKTHLTRMQELLNLTKHLDLEPTDFNLIINAADVEEDVIGAKTFQEELGIPQMIEFPRGQAQSSELSIRFGKKEQSILDQQIQYLLNVFGLEPEEDKKRRFFG